MTTPPNMSFIETLHSAHRTTWDAAISHRFIQELSAGTLPNSIMSRYLIQDHRFLSHFLSLLGATLSGADTLSARIRLGRFIGDVSGPENTYFLRAFAALGIDDNRRTSEPDNAATAGFKALMEEAAATRSYAVCLAVLVVAEGLYLDWASRVPRPLSQNFVHAEWVTLHDNEDFKEFVEFLRGELERVGEGEKERCEEFFGRAVVLEKAFFDAAYEG